MTEKNGRGGSFPGQRQATATLAGKRILIVEDEFLALSLEEILQGQGCVTLGPATSPEDALHVISNETLDAAVLDINLNGRMVYPAALALTDRGVPFLFTSGYRGPDVPVPFRDVTRLEKPIDAELLIDALRTMLG